MKTREKDEIRKAVRDSYGRGHRGQCYLLGRRLIERGVRFVTVDVREPRTGNMVGGVLRNAAVFPALADINWDGLPDLVMAWGTTGVGDRNVRVLFGAAR